MSRKIQKLIVDKNRVVSVPVMFDGGLLSSARAEMVNELLKYFLYERQQMPMSFDHVKREVYRDEVSGTLFGRTYFRYCHIINNRIGQITFLCKCVNVRTLTHRFLL